MKNSKIMVVVVALVVVGMLAVTWFAIDYWHHKKGFVAGENPVLEDEGVEEVLVEDVLVEEVLNEYDVYYVYTKNENTPYGVEGHKIEIPAGAEIKVTCRYYMVKLQGEEFWRAYDVEEVYEDGTMVVDLVPGMYTKVGQ